MNFVNVTQASQEDAEELSVLFKIATDNMISAGIDQWNYTYPLLSHVKQDIEDEIIFVLKDNNKIAATISLDDKQDLQYKKIRWNFITKKALVIHRLAVHPDYQGKSLGKTMCLFAEHFGSLHQFDGIRLDAYSRNPVSLRLYHNLGYKIAGGYCYFHKNRAPFYCFDKKIKI